MLLVIDYMFYTDEPRAQLQHYSCSGIFPVFLLQAFLNVLDQCPKIEVDVPLVKSYLAQFAARAIIAELVSVAELAHPLENGTHFPLFLLCLQQTARLKDREWLTDLFQQSKVNMQKMLPGIALLLTLPSSFLLKMVFAFITLPPIIPLTDVCVCLSVRFISLVLLFLFDPSLFSIFHPVDFSCFSFSPSLVCAPSFFLHLITSTLSSVLF